MLFSKTFVEAPNTSEEWLSISREFEFSWNFLNFIDAIDGKHIIMPAPESAGSEYSNHIRDHSIVLLSVCDARYRLTLMDKGYTGRISDGERLQTV